jgi:hypothetical protein
LGGVWLRSCSRERLGRGALALSRPLARVRSCHAPAAKHKRSLQRQRQRGDAASQPLARHLVRIGALRRTRIGAIFDGCSARIVPSIVACISAQARAGPGAGRGARRLVRLRLRLS